MGQIKEYEYVDLGLPSGLKWAKCNVGAETETDYGYYFQWGDIEDKSKSDCSWRTYKHYNGSSDTLTKYNNSTSFGETLDNKTTLGLEDDAARAHMGNDWRMPTRDEFRELFDYTNNEWISNYNGTGVNGRKFTSKTNGNSIFIPASERYKDFSTYIQDISYGVWSSSLYTSRPREAWTLDFNSSHIEAEDEYTCPYDRYYGMVVRGVL